MLTVLGRQFHASQQLVRLRAARNANDLIEEEATFGERIADSVARFGGSWTFIITFGIVLVVYASLNTFLLRQIAWDPYPFILLNLFLSMLAALQAPIIMMSQNRQDTEDRLRSELDFDVNRRAAAEIQGLARKLNVIGEKIIDLEDVVREAIPSSGRPPPALNQRHHLSKYKSRPSPPRLVPASCPCPQGRSRNHYAARNSVLPRH